MNSSLLETNFLIQHLAQITGFKFEIQLEKGDNNRNSYLISPDGYLTNHTFSVRVITEEQRISLTFKPGIFAADLLVSMRNVDNTGRKLFYNLLTKCINEGAKINLTLNHKNIGISSNAIWEQDWNQFELTMNKDQLPFEVNESHSNLEIIGNWTGNFLNAIIAILPIDETFQI